MMHACKVVVLLNVMGFFCRTRRGSSSSSSLVPYHDLLRPITRHLTKQTHGNMDSIGFIYLFNEKKGINEKLTTLRLA